MAKPVKQLITVVIDHDLKWDMDGCNLEDVIMNLQRHYDNNKEDFESLYIDIDQYNDYGDHTINVALKGRRLETDDEFQARISVAKAYQDKQDQKDAKEYARLKKKFENASS